MGISQRTTTGTSLVMAMCAPGRQTHTLMAITIDITSIQTHQSVISHHDINTRTIK
jgi:hypothetical protein